MVSKEHLKDAESLKRKDGQRVNSQLQIVKQFQNKVPRCKTAKPLNIRSSSVHNFIKKDISACKEAQLKISILACDLWVLVSKIYESLE